MINSHDLEYIGTCSQKHVFHSTLGYDEKWARVSIATPLVCEGKYEKMLRAQHR